MTELYRAEDSRLRRVVTFKLLEVEHIGNPEARALLEHEARLLARLDHPNIVAFHDLGRLGDEPCLTLGPVGHHGLGGWLAAKSRRDSEILAVLIQAGRGLAAAHAGGVAHCNLTPEQIRVDERGAVRLINFELGSELDPPPGAWERDRPRFDGDPSYMAPEARKAGRRDAAADQYSFCAVAWEALTGVRPQADPQVSMRSGGRRVRATLAILARGLALEPSARWPDLAALVAALEAQSKRSPARRRRRFTILGVAVVTITALVLLAIFWR